MGSDEPNPTAGSREIMNSAVKASARTPTDDQKTISLFVHNYGYSRREVAAAWGYSIPQIRRLIGDEGEMHAICAVERHGLCEGNVLDVVSGEERECSCSCHRLSAGTT